jgi:hypothetical protein
MVVLAFAWTAASAHAYVVWGWYGPSDLQSGIGRAQQDGSGVSAQLVSISGRDQLSYKNTLWDSHAGVAIDGDYAYWGWYAPSDDQSGIGRAKLGGSDVSARYVGISGSDHVNGLAVAGNYIYWSWDAPSSDSAGIGRAELNGSHVNGDFLSLSGRDDVGGLAVNGSDIYWGWLAPSDDQAGIGRAELNGSHANNSFISVSSRDQIAGVTVNGTYLYWAWKAPSILQSGIGRAKLNGSGVNGRYIGFSAADQPAGVGLDGSYLYWGWYAPSNDGSGIGRAKLDGSDVKDTFISISGRDQLGGVAVGGPPANTTAPHITGTAKQADKLTEHHGSWLNAVSSYKYQWERCNSSGNSCSSISGATHSTYTLSVHDVGHRIRVKETAVNASGDSESATSGATSTVLPSPPTIVSVPTISANASEPFEVGVVATEVHGTWSPAPDNPTSYSYQWEACDSSGANCAPIAGATAQTYTLLYDEIGQTLRVEETATDSGGSSAPAVSAQTLVVQPPTPTILQPPSINGTLIVGDTLDEVQALWLNDPATYAYQWFRCSADGINCVAIAGATASMYTLTPADGFHTIAVQETASNGGGTSAPSISKPTGEVRPVT